MHEIEDEVRLEGWEKNDAYFGDFEDYEDQYYEMDEDVLEKKEQRTKYINNRYTKAEYDEISEQAQLAGLSTSAFVRKRALGLKLVAHNDLTILRELRRIGGLIKHLYSQGHKSEEMDKTWQSLQQTFKIISNNFNMGMNNDY